MPPSTLAPSAPHAATLLDQALAPVQEELHAVATRLLSELTDPVTRRVVYLITAGGKRLRPALVLLAGRCGPAPERGALIEAATAVELIHTATLIHDDIIDQAPLRRARPSFHQRWGTERAVLMGDYLHATAFTLLARLQAPSVMQAIADVCRQLCRGELREVEARFRLDLTEEEYLAIVHDKTASLIGGCCRSGALLGGCAPGTVEQLTAFGVNFGTAFQIIDDCLDLAGDQQELGKLVLTDLDKGTLSLPIIYLTQALSPAARDRLFAPLKDRNVDPQFLVRVAAEARAAGAIDRARQRARRMIQAGLDALAGTPMNGLFDLYRQLADYAIARRS